MTDSRSILDELKQIMGDRQAYLREHPIPFAVACQPRFYAQIHQQINPAAEPFPTPNSTLGLIPGICIYVWSRLPIPLKDFQTEEEFQQWKELYGEEGDR